MRIRGIECYDDFSDPARITTRVRHPEKTDFSELEQEVCRYIRESVRPQNPIHMRLQVGQPLYYRNKHTGKIEMGYVMSIQARRFQFLFEMQSRWLSNSLLCKRLFFTKEDAIRFSPLAVIEGGLKK